MTVLVAPAEPTHDIGAARFTSLATPTRGTHDMSVWQVEIPPRTPGAAHSLTREEIFVVLEGEASVDIGGVFERARTGDAIVVPPETVFVLANASDETLRLLCCLPVGGQARMSDGEPFTPPWAE